MHCVLLIGHFGERVFPFGAVNIRFGSEGPFLQSRDSEDSPTAGVLGLVDAAKMGVECDVLGSHLRDLAALRRLAVGKEPVND
jgi:hypothetical protein